MNAEGINDELMEPEALEMGEEPDCGNDRYKICDHHQLQGSRVLQVIYGVLRGLCPSDLSDVDLNRRGFGGRAPSGEDGTDQLQTVWMTSALRTLENKGEVC